MTEKELTGKESLELITSMINQAKRNFKKGGSFYFLLWGWVVMTANLGHYYLDVFTDYAHPYIVWLITFPAALVSIWYGRKLRNQTKVVNHMDHLYGQVWLAIGAGIVIALFFMSPLGFNHNAVIMLLSGIGTYLCGAMLRFKPLMIGGLILGVTSIVCFNVPISEQYLVGGIGIFAGYLIPGYLLKRVEK